MPKVGKPKLDQFHLEEENAGIDESGPELIDSEIIPALNGWIFKKKGRRMWWNIRKI